MELEVYNSDGSKAGKKKFSIPVLEENEGIDALLRVLKSHRNNQRQGNACAKTRSEVSGTGKKPWRQKGTGRARHGSLRSPIWRGGGVTHGPRPRDYRVKLNKKLRRLAFSRALFDSASEGYLSVIEEFSVSDHKTKSFSEFITKIYTQGEKVLIVQDDVNRNLVLAARNIPKVTVTEAATLNSFDLVAYKHVLVSEKGMEIIINRANVEGE